MIGDKHERTIKIFKNILNTFAIKGISILVNLALVPMTIHYLTPSKYGVYLTISSMIAWVSFFDIGLGHGLRNKLAEAIAKGDLSRAKAYVSTAYISIGSFLALLLLVFVAANHFLNWNKLLNIPSEEGENIQFVALVLFSLFTVQFLLQLIHTIFLSVQRPALVSFYNMLANVFVLALIYVLKNYTKGTLMNVCLISSLVPVLILLFVNIYYFKTEFSNFSPSFRFFQPQTLKEILNLGFQFFIIQITVLVFYQTSNLLICRYFSPEMVTPYNIAFRYFGIITMIFSIITAPYWSAYTEAYVKKDFDWIKKSIRTILKIWSMLALLAIVMFFASNFVYQLWVGKSVKVDLSISFFMMVYTLVVSFGNIYIMFINGIGQIKLQMIVNVISMIAFFPLSYFLAVHLALGVVGIIISTIICSIYGPLIAPFEVRRFLKNNQSSF